MALVMQDDEQFYKEPTRKEWLGFWTLVAVQAQNAFNEKAVQFLLIPLGVWVLSAGGSELEYLLGAIFVIPYILFSPLVGWLADCFCKTRIIQVMSFLQIVVMGCMLYCFYCHSLYPAIAWFAVFATQATILSPAKKGIVKDLLGSRYIAFGSGIIEMSMVFVLLLAQIGVFFLFSFLHEYYTAEYIAEYGSLDNDNETGWQAVILPTCIFLGLAVLVFLASFLVPRYGVAQHRKFSWSLLYEHFGQMKYLLRDRNLRLSEMGIAYFWCLAGSLFLIVIQIAKEMQMQDASVDFSLQCGILMSWLGGGVIIGGLVATTLCKRKNELGLIPLGSIGMTISLMLMFILEVNSLGGNIALACTGAWGAIFLVPLNAYLQDSCDPANRGNIIAAGNLFDNLMGLLAVALIWFMHECGAGPQDQYFVLFLMSVFIMCNSLRLIPQDFIRLVGIWMLRFVYRVRVVNADNIPERGGALLVANHVTYADAVFITMCSKRPVRFIVADDFTSSRIIRYAIGWILEIFDSLPISAQNPREALNQAVEALKKGEVICIFPEGQLTRTGCLLPMRRGMEFIARGSGKPVIPIYCDGLWGSIFSNYRNRYFTKLPRAVPYPVTVVVGDPIPAEEVDCRKVLRTFRALSSECLEVSADTSREYLVRILERTGKKVAVSSTDGCALSGYDIANVLGNHHIPDEVSPECRTWLELLLNCTDDLLSLHRAWLNVNQVRRVNALKEGRHRLLTSVGHNEPHELVLGVLWPIITGTPVVLLSTGTKARLGLEISQIVGAAVMRRFLLTGIPPRQVPFYDFSGGADLSTPNMRWRPCMATAEGMVIAMSMVRSVFKLSDGAQQLGARPRTRGLLLPGYKVEDSVRITAPCLTKPFVLPETLYLDESGFLAQLQVESRNA